MRRKASAAWSDIPSTSITAGRFGAGTAPRVGARAAAADGAPRTPDERRLGARRAVEGTARGRGRSPARRGAGPTRLLAHPDRRATAEFVRDLDALLSRMLSNALRSHVPEDELPV